MNKLLPLDNIVHRSTYEAKKLISDLGLDYQKIHACMNDCMLLRKECKNVDICRKCGHSRWKAPSYNVEKGDISRKHKRNHKGFLLK